MAKGLQAIMDRLPHRKSEIEWLTGRNSTFLEICEDYTDATVALKYWSATTPNATVEARKTEYRTLAEELAIEIEQMLNASGLPEPGKARDVFSNRREPDVED